MKLRHWAFQIGWKLVRWGNRGRPSTGVEYVSSTGKITTCPEVTWRLRG